MRVLRWLILLLAAALALLVLAAAALWWWTGTQGSARWAMEQLGRRVPVVAEGVGGSLRHGLHADRLAWQQDGLSVEARQVRLAWQPLPLLQRNVQLDRLEAAQLHVQDRRPPTEERLRPPDSLVLPVRVQVEELAIGRLLYEGRTRFDARELAGAYRFDGAAHEVALRNLRVFGGHYRGQLRLGARAPFSLVAKLQGRISAPVPGAPQPLPLLFEAGAEGTLERFAVDARLQAEPGSVATGAPHATVHAQVTPFTELPLASARADLESLDIGAIWPEAPHALLTGQVALQAQGPGAWAVSADLRNALPGPWDRRRLPARRVRLEGDWRAPARALVRELEAEVGGGRVVARGRWEGEDAWRLEGRLAGVDPAALHSTLAPLPVSGPISARGEGSAIAFEVALEAAGPARAAPGSQAAAAVGALEVRSLQARGRWAGEDVSLPLLAVRTSDARLDAAVDLRLRGRSGRGRIDLEAPGLRVRAVGSVGPTHGGGNARVGVASVAEAQAWLRKLPFVPAPLHELPLAGRGDLQLAWQGGWDDPSVEGQLTLPALQPEAAAGTGRAWSLRNLTARLDGRLADARLELRTHARWQAREADVELAGRGGRNPRGEWQGQLGSLQLALRDPEIAPHPWRVALRRPVDLRWASGRLETGAGEASLAAPLARGTGGAPALLSWEASQWDGRQLRTAGRLTGLPMAWLELLSPQLAGSALAGDLVFDARWDAQVGDALRVQAVLERRSGDVSVLAETAEGARARVQAGVREAALTVLADGESLTATLRWDSERAGTAQAQLASRLARDGEGWAWPEDAPLTGAVRAQLPRLGVWSLLAPPGWRLRGSLAADVAVAGTRANPQLSGQLRADDLALRSVVEGVSLQDGRLRARLEGRQLVVEELLLRGAGPAGGSVAGTGAGTWSREGLQVQVSARLDRLRVSARSDRELAVSGQVTGRMDARAAEVRGDLRVDQARIVLPDEAAPRLGDDVVVRNLPPGVTLGRGRPSDTAVAGAGGGRRPLTLAVALDLGNDFRVRGRGVDTRLAGTLAIAGESLDEPRLTGVIRTMGGEYRAYGQRLDIERGVLRFTGPVDDPALDVLAIRPRLEQRVGVQVTGRAQSPFVRLFSEPDLPEAEKLAWLVLGRSAAAGGAETALLQSAALALLQSRTGSGGGRGPAQLLGLDELGFRREGAEGPAVTLGKRLGRNLYASYERSLSGALGTLYVFYDLSQRLTVRAQAGERAAVDLIFTFSYD